MDLDGDRIASGSGASTSFQVAPGSYRVRARRSGYLLAEREVAVVAEKDNQRFMELSPESPPDETEAELFPVVEDGRQGYIDSNGLIRISPRFREAGGFSEGLAAAAETELFGYIESDGGFRVLPQFASAARFSEGRALVELNDSLWYIDYDGVPLFLAPGAYAGPFRDGRAVFSSPPAHGAPRYGYMDRLGRTVIPPRFTDASDFSEGTAAVRDDRNRYYVVDVAGDHAFPHPPEGFTYAEPFSDNRALVERDGRLEFIGRDGKTLFEVPGRNARSFRGERARFEVEAGATGAGPTEAGATEAGASGAGPTGAGPTEAGQAGAVSLFGYLDLSGEIAIEARYRNAGDFSEGRAHVEENGLWGYIDSSGAMVIEPRWNAATPFSDGLALVAQGQTRRSYRSGYINRSGEVVWRSDGN
jgi:hypothetical protein